MGQEKPKTKAPKIQRLITPVVLQRAREDKKKGAQTRAHRQSQGRRQRLCQAARPQAEGKEGTEVVSSSFLRLSPGVNLRKSYQEAERLQMKSMMIMIMAMTACDPSDAQLLFKISLLEFGFH